eukprot:3267237-Pyramimonas_sp.AAC.1
MDGKGVGVWTGLHWLNKGLITCPRLADSWSIASSRRRFIRSTLATSAATARSPSPRVLPLLRALPTPPRAGAA